MIRLIFRKRLHDECSGLGRVVVSTCLAQPYFADSEMSQREALGGRTDCETIEVAVWNRWILFLGFVAHTEEIRLSENKFAEIEDVADLTAFKREREDWIHCTLEDITKFHIK